ncbi:hypothetical protein EDD86DRAFT_247436 [Gorgonomyces haynaldii]|nr:hypothetical protein EDD86DRAFT_247436 [Gorgonomyces haynaldii]
MQLTAYLVIAIALVTALIISLYYPMEDTYVIRQVVNLLFFPYLMLLVFNCINVLDKMRILFSKLRQKCLIMMRCVLVISHVVFVGPLYWQIRDIGTGVFVIGGLLFNEISTILVIRRLQSMRQELLAIREVGENPEDTARQDRNINFFVRFSFAGVCIDTLGFICLLLHLTHAENTYAETTESQMLYFLTLILFGFRMPAFVLSTIAIQNSAIVEISAPSPRPGTPSLVQP